MAPACVDGRAAWRQALLELLTEPGPAFAMFSPDYADWPLNQPELIEALDAWAQGRRQPCVRMLAQRYDVIERDAPRFVAWRSRQAHLVQCNIIDEGAELPPEGLLLRDRGLLALPGDHGRSAVYREGLPLREALECFDVAWERSSPGQLSRPLGL